MVHISSMVYCFKYLFSEGKMADNGGYLEALLDALDEHDGDLKASAHAAEWRPSPILLEKHSGLRISR